ncbi:MAG: hypothetical protein IPM42_15480 [Saprospiraceae bacterium]|nr:hypothetical protein [Saprospiraceae bacterium]
MSIRKVILTIEEEARTANSRFAKAGGSCFYDSEVLNSSFVHLVKFSGKNPRLRKAAKRYVQVINNKKENMKNQIKILIVILLTSSCSQSSKNNQQGVQNLVNETAEVKAQPTKEEIKRFRDTIQSNYEELLAFKDKEDFHKNGFGMGNKYNNWLITIQKHKDNPLAKELLKERIVVGEIESLGMEFLKSNGKETEITKVFTNDLNRAFFTNEEIAKVEVTQEENNEMSQGKLVGLWKVTNSTVKQSYEFKILEKNGKFIGIKNDDLTNSEVLTKKGNKYIVQGNRFGEYYTVDSNRKMELFDQDGELESLGYTAILIK